MLGDADHWGYPQDSSVDTAHRNKGFLGFSTHFGVRESLRPEHLRAASLKELIHILKGSLPLFLLRLLFLLVFLSCCL